MDWELALSFPRLKPLLRVFDPDINSGGTERGSPSSWLLRGAEAQRG